MPCRHRGARVSANVRKTSSGVMAKSHRLSTSTNAGSFASSAPCCCPSFPFFREILGSATPPKSEKASGPPCRRPRPGASALGAPLLPLMPRASSRKFATSFSALLPPDAISSAEPSPSSMPASSPSAAAGASAAGGCWTSKPQASNNLSRSLMRSVTSRRALTCKSRRTRPMPAASAPARSRSPLGRASGPGHSKMPHSSEEKAWITDWSSRSTRKAKMCSEAACGSYPGVRFSLKMRWICAS
mmetsp:Transcript_81336/g.235858  ORF Transcript_81336/g.235858 Transcript_81336/m.235858 type:complete len:244 (+) Transcript_81336:791-1522(+)